VKTLGRAAHSSTPELGLNAIYKMAEVIQCIARMNMKLRATKKEHPLLGFPTISADMVEGGANPWVIPEYCSMVVNRRTLPGERKEDVVEELEQELQELRRRDKTLRSDIATREFCEACEISPDETIVKAAKAATSQVLGEETRIGGLSGTTDARFLVNDGKIPTVILGPGSLSQAHKADEYVSLREVQRAARIYRSIATQLLA